MCVEWLLHLDVLCCQHLRLHIRHAHTLHHVMMCVVMMCVVMMLVTRTTESRLAMAGGQGNLAREFIPYARYSSTQALVPLAEPVCVEASQLGPVFNSSYMYVAWRTAALVACCWWLLQVLGRCHSCGAARPDKTLHVHDEHASTLLF